jgi:hypothetical protein
MNGAIPTLPQYAFIAWCSVRKKSRGATLPLPLIHGTLSTYMLHVSPARGKINSSEPNRKNLTECNTGMLTETTFSYRRTGRGGEEQQMKSQQTRNVFLKESNACH